MREGRDATAHGYAGADRWVLRTVSFWSSVPGGLDDRVNLWLDENRNARDITFHLAAASEDEDGSGAWVLITYYEPAVAGGAE